MSLVVNDGFGSFSSALLRFSHPVSHCSHGLCITCSDYMLQRWSDSVFCYPILSCFLKMISVSDPHPVLVKIILSVSENVLWCTTYIFVLCLLCLMRQNHCWNYFTFSWTRLAEVVTLQVSNKCPTSLTVISVTAHSHLYGQVLSLDSGLASS